MSNESFEIKKIKQNPFVMVDHTLINYDKISWQAKGLLIYILSKPSNWKVYMSDIEKHATNGNTSIRSILKELRESGFMVLNKITKDNGVFFEWSYSVFDAPLKKPIGKFRVIKLSEKDKIKYTKSDFVNLEELCTKGKKEDSKTSSVKAPDVDKQHLRKPDVEKQLTENSENEFQLSENAENENQLLENAEIEKQLPGKPDVEKPHVDSPQVETLQVENPHMEKPHVENAPYSNINNSNIISTNNEKEKDNIKSNNQINQSKEKMKINQEMEDEIGDSEPDMQLNIFENADEISYGLKTGINQDKIIEKEIKENIEYDFVKENREEIFAFVDACYELIKEVLLISGETIRIASSEKSLYSVQERFRKIRLEHIEYIYESFEESAPRIKNIKSYLLTSLYNAPVTMNPYLQNKVENLLKK